MRAKTSTALCLALALAFSLAPRAQGAFIVWNEWGRITGDSDVKTAGTLVAAANFYGNTTTVNGVTFQGMTTSSGNISLSSSFNLTGTATGFGSTSAPFSNLSPSYRSLLESGAYSEVVSQQNFPAFSMTITGLEFGAAYTIEVWVNDSQDFVPGGRTRIADGQAALTLFHNRDDAVGGLGEYGYGSFLATGATQQLSFSSSVLGPNGLYRSQINAIQIRLGPEPAFATALIVSCAAMLQRQPRRTTCSTRESA